MPIPRNDLLAVQQDISGLHISGRSGAQDCIPGTFKVDGETATWDEPNYAGAYWPCRAALEVIDMIYLRRFDSPAAAESGETPHG